MGAVFDEIITEVEAPSTTGDSNEGGPASQTSSPPKESDIELCQQLERINERQCRLMAD